MLSLLLLIYCIVLDGEVGVVGVIIVASPRCLSLLLFLFLINVKMKG